MVSIFASDFFSGFTVFSLSDIVSFIVEENCAKKLQLDERKRIVLEKVGNKYEMIILRK